MINDELPTMRIARAAMWFAQGEAMTVRELSEKLSITTRGARSMLEKMSASIPLCEDGGLWFIRSEDGESHGDQ